MWRISTNGYSKPVSYTHLLEKREYLGHTINFKTRKHFKDKKSHYVPEDEWTIFENTHEAIIDQQTFGLVQKIRGNVRRYPDGWGEAAPLTGLLYCADCGGKMYVHRTNNGKRISQYTCSQYSKIPVGKLCATQHRINEDVVLSLVSEMLKAIAEYAKHDRAEFVRVVQEAQSSQQTTEVRKQRTRLATAKQRISELEVLLCKIYEDNILGKLSDNRYATLDAQYAKEQAELTDEISALEKAIRSYEKHEKDADRFIALIGKYENFDKLTIAMLNEFIEKILVHERDRKGSIQTTQEVEIYFNFVGRFVPPAFGEVELTPEELEEIRKREERKDRLHPVSYTHLQVSWALMTSWFTTMARVGSLRAPMWKWPPRPIPWRVTTRWITSSRHLKTMTASSSRCTTILSLRTTHMSLICVIRSMLWRRASIAKRASMI